MERTPYDTAEMSILDRFRHALIERHGWLPEDFEGMTFTDIEWHYLDAGEPDFRPDDDF